MTTRIGAEVRGESFRSRSSPPAESVCEQRPCDFFVACRQWPSQNDSEIFSSDDLVSHNGRWGSASLPPHGENSILYFAVEIPAVAGQGVEMRTHAAEQTCSMSTMNTVSMFSRGTRRVLSTFSSVKIMSPRWQNGESFSVLGSVVQSVRKLRFTGCLSFVHRKQRTTGP